MPGFYFRKHYFLLTLPAPALLAGCAVSGPAGFGVGKSKSSSLPTGRFGVALIITATVIVKSGIWFIQISVQVSRATYGADPLRECELVASYIRDNSSPDARVTVLGSEPAIYFFSRRRSVTGYIYTYGLMEEQPFARRMQDEMIREIEIPSAGIHCFCRHPLSWSRKPGSDLRIFHWWDSYQTNYTLVGLADIISPTKPCMFGVGKWWTLWQRYSWERPGNLPKQNHREKSLKHSGPPRLIKICSRLNGWGPIQSSLAAGLTIRLFAANVSWLAQNAAASATSSLFADILKAPAVQSLARRLEHGGVLTCAGVSQAAQPFFAAAPKNLPATPHRRCHRQP